MELEVSNLATRTATMAGCGIHHSPHDFKLRYPHLEKWRLEHIDLFGSHGRPGPMNLERPIAHAQHLDPNSVAFGVLGPASERAGRCQPRAQRSAFLRNQ